MLRAHNISITTGKPKEQQKEKAPAPGAFPTAYLFSFFYALVGFITPHCLQSNPSDAIVNVDKSASYRLNDWICQYDCVHAESRQPHFHALLVHEQM
jgi:hypothetical protein